jgi:1,4-alpha-glucan branching enzyme
MLSTSFKHIKEQLVRLVSRIKNMKKSKKVVVKVVERTPAEAVKPVTVKAEAPPPPRVVLELVNPAAKQVFVAGSFNSWHPEQTPLVPAGNGRWAGNLKVGPGRHEYLFVVDGQWLPDPNAKESVENPFGGKNSVLTVSE